MRISALDGCLLLPWWISESELDNWIYWRKLRASTSMIGLMNLCLLIPSWSLCNWLRLRTRVLDWLNWAQLLILDVGILLLVNGPQDTSWDWNASWSRPEARLSGLISALTWWPCGSNHAEVTLHCRNDCTMGSSQSLKLSSTWNSWSTHSSGGGTTWLGAQGFLLRSEALLPRPSLGF